MSSVNTKKLAALLPLYAAEGWEVEGDKVWAYGKKFDLKPPVFIHLATYRDSDKWETRLEAMINAHRLLWPDRAKTFNYWQERMFRVHCQRRQTISFAGGSGIGKCLVQSCPIRTPIGWTTMGTVKVGETICDTVGGVQTVLGVYPQGTKPVYKVSFSDGTSTEASDEHLWTVYSNSQRTHGTGPQTVTTTELLKNLQKNFSLPNYSAVAGVPQNFIVDPYLLGVYLGNGGLHVQSKTGQLQCYVSNFETVEEIKKIWKNVVYSWDASHNYWCVFCKGLREHIEVYGCANAKYIPKQYLIASPEQRLHLLQGLMDTDGYCSKDGTAQYTTVSEKLRDDVADLARGLGLMVSISSKIPSYSYKGEKKKGQRAYTLSIRKTHTTAHLSLFRVLHKRIRDEKPRKQYYHKRIVDIKYLRDDQTVCIKVSHPNSLYLINDYIVTHNTSAAAEIGAMFFLSDPQKNAVIVASTTLASLRSRIYGYVERCLRECAIKYPYETKESMPPSIHPMQRDFIHGIYAVAATKGDDEASIRNWIGRHPRGSLLLILDEATDLPIGIIPAMANLSKGLGGYFEAIAIGNSSDKTDLHGLLSTPKDGWESIDPRRDTSWETTQPDGICLYFNPYESPAIHEEDPEKKALLSKFLMNEETLVKAEQSEGTESETFWRFTMGFWKSASTDNAVMSELYLKEYNCRQLAEFSGLQDLKMVAGLDPAFTSGGDKCILRLAVLGHHAATGKIVLDFRDTALLFEIRISALAGKSAEAQIADATLQILRKHNVSLRDLFIDANASGRGLADVITLTSGGIERPAKVFSNSKFAGKLLSKQNGEPHAYVIDSYELWFSGRKFIGTQQIFGLDFLSSTQLHMRQSVTKGGKRILESKGEFKKRLNAQRGIIRGSPDEADAAMLAIQAAVINYGFHENQRIELRRFPTPEDRAYYLATGGNPTEVGEKPADAFFPTLNKTSGIVYRPFQLTRPK